MSNRMSALQKRILAYLASVAESGVARITQEELSAGVGAHRGSVCRSLYTLEHKGLVKINVVRATFVTICEAA